MRLVDRLGDPVRVTVDLKGCARCFGEGHPRLIFQRLEHPVELDAEPPLTYWATCPTTREPILMRLEGRT